MESEMMDASLVRAVLADAGVSGELLEGLTEGCVEMERMKRRKVCVNYAEWLCGEGRCETCRSYATEWEDGGKDRQLTIFE